jgi:hypothetical protein
MTRWPQKRDLGRSSLHTRASASATAVPSTVLGHAPGILRWMGRVWRSRLARDPLGAPGERQDDEERGRLPPPVHRLLRSALYSEPVPHGPAAHSITSSARARIEGGIVRPKAFAVLRLTTSSKLVDCWTGRSAGLAPLSIFPR